MVEQDGVLNTDLGKQLEAETSARRHRYAVTVELYVLLEGNERIRAVGELLTLSPLSAVLVDPDTVRQVFNDTDREQLWLIVGAPREGANTLEMTAEALAFI